MSSSVELSGSASTGSNTTRYGQYSLVQSFASSYPLNSSKKTVAEYYKKERRNKPRTHSHLLYPIKLSRYFHPLPWNPAKLYTISQ